jgi:hypothetical protein
MLIILHESFAAPAANPNTANIRRQALELVAMARRQGKHLLFADRKVFDALLALPDITDVAKQVLRTVYNRLPQKSGLLQAVSRCVEISIAATDVSMRLDNGRRVVVVPASNLVNQDFATLDRTILLCEDISDCHFFEATASAFASSAGLGRVMLAHERRGGGGQNTGNQFGEIQNNTRRLCLCVVDSDRLCPPDPQNPSGGIGTTARAVVDQHVAERFLTEYWITPVREKENLLSTALLEAVLRDPVIAATLQRLRAVEALVSHARDFFDLQHGTRLKHIMEGAPNSRHAKFWAPIVAALPPGATGINEACRNGFLCAHGGACACLVSPNIGSHALETALDAIAKMPDAAEVMQHLEERISAIWNEIGRLVLSWTCGTHPLAAL